MIKISHRGNLRGRIENRENTLSYINEALESNFNVEIDIRVIARKIYLGHDLPQEEIDLTFLVKNKNKLWIHCKNLAALELILENNLIGFFHQQDDFTLTTNNLIWTYPKRETCNKSIIVLEKYVEISSIPKGIYGICSDYIAEYENEK